MGIVKGSRNHGGNGMNRILKKGTGWNDVKDREVSGNLT